MDIACVMCIIYDIRQTGIIVLLFLTTGRRLVVPGTQYAYRMVYSRSIGSLSRFSVNVGAVRMSIRTSSICVLQSSTVDIQKNMNIMWQGLRDTAENWAESSTMALCHTANVHHVYSTRHQKGADLGILDFYRSTRYRWFITSGTPVHHLLFMAGVWTWCT
jgi:hypothetical protein